MLNMIGFFSATQNNLDSKRGPWYKVVDNKWSHDDNERPKNDNERLHVFLHLADDPMDRSYVSVRV